jgi:hypothetical protein
LGGDGFQSPQRIQNHLDHTLDILEYFVVPEPQYHESRLLQPLCPRQIVSRLIGVLAAVEFDDQLPFQAGEIEYEAAERMLPFELAALQLTIPQMPP